MSTLPQAGLDGVPGDGIVPVGDRVYNEVLQFLYTEGRLLDDNRLEEWLGLLDPAVVYRAPVRTTVARGDGPGFSRGSFYFNETRGSLELRVKHATSPNDWSEQPPSRTRRLITNVLVEQSGADLLATSSLLLVRSRWDLPQPELWSAQRHDQLARSDGHLKIRRRDIHLDHTNIQAPNLGIFL
jgi:3-phenylpropionate/cinnamic acid dioxygenase small subunit